MYTLFPGFSTTATKMPLQITLIRLRQITQHDQKRQ